MVVPMASAKETAELLAGKIMGKLGLQSGDEICLVVNGSGKTTQMELYITFRDAKIFLESLLSEAKHMQSCKMGCFCVKMVVFCIIRLISFGIFSHL